MARILAVGIATLDIVNIVAAFPPEDAEVRALSQHQSRGGNATNTLTILSQLGHHCAWAGVYIDTPASQLIEMELRQHHIDLTPCTRLTSGTMPTSYITVSQRTGSRTIVHYRDCPEYSFEDFQRLDLSHYDWLHFEGRHIPDTQKMLELCASTYPHIPRSVEIEKPRNGIESLFPYADLLLFSQPYAEQAGYHDAAAFLQSGSITCRASCTWGKEGAWLINTDKQLFHSPAFSPETVVDTLGAGDTFNAGLIHSLLQHDDEQQALDFACQLAGYKCGQHGLSLSHWPGLS